MSLKNIIVVGGSSVAFPNVPSFRGAELSALKYTTSAHVGSKALQVTT